MKFPLPKNLVYRVLLVWAIALLVSLGVRWVRGFESVGDSAGAYTGGANDNGPIAWRDFSNGEAAHRLPVVLLHGNPVAGSSMVPLALELAEGRRVLVPDLPGFGYSASPSGSFGAREQVPALVEWLTQLDVERAHWVGYSQGAVSALEVAVQFPESAASVTLLAGVGLQEHELFGDYRLNQSVYVLEYAALWTLRWLTPHFGLLDRPWLAPRTARNFMDTDLRRSRALLESVAQPVLILHAVDDRLVPFEAARAHAGIVPQAAFEAVPGGHMAPIRRARSVAAAMQPFLSSVEEGAALTRGRALQDGAAAKPAILLEADAGASAFQELFFGAILFFMVFLSEDLACIAAGLLAAKGVISFAAGTVACFVGIWVSDLLLYLVGCFLGPAVFKVGFIRRSAEGGRVRSFAEAYERNGAKVIFLTRFIPGSRVAAYTTAGVLRIGFVRFAFWLGVAALVWTPVLVGLAYLIGNPLVAWWEKSGWIVLPVVGLALVIVYLAFTLLLQCFDHRGRRRIYGRWVRCTRWEFWPRWAVYLPVLFRCVFLSLKHRSLTVWAASNPGIGSAGGLVLESKSAILEGLSARPDRVARWACIRPGPAPDRVRAVRDLQANLSAAWPIVLKPDVGQRGEGVAVLHDGSEVESYLGRNEACVIAQEYVPGSEFGVFYVRFPGASSGQIFSITEKVLPEVEGDGDRTVEELIIDDPRAVALADHYLKVNRSRLREVPPARTRVRLVELGTHCRGAIFLDGNRWKSDALRKALDEVLEGFDGFHFGRFDLRVPSGEDLADGRNFRILELNGVSSEATDIYDPKHGIFHAWRVLSRQWELAYAIGVANRKRGASVPSVRDIVKLLAAYRRRTVFDVDTSAATEAAAAFPFSVGKKMGESPRSES